MDLVSQTMSRASFPWWRQQQVFTGIPTPPASCHLISAGQYSPMVQPQPSYSTAPPAQSVSNDLIVQALNYHGQQLTSFVKETKLFEHLDMKNVDYHLYHQRSRELRMEDRGKRLLLHRY